VGNRRAALPGAPQRPRRPSCVLGNVRKPGAWRGCGLVGGSRFLEFPIQMGVAESAQLRRTRTAHAPLHTKVGGYMRGERRERENEETVECRSC
jgi:hypothetical protein